MTIIQSPFLLEPEAKREPAEPTPKRIATIELPREVFN
jgi:hypothetical protein